MDVKNYTVDELKKLETLVATMPGRFSEEEHRLLATVKILTNQMALIAQKCDLLQRPTMTPEMGHQLIAELYGLAADARRRLGA